MRLLSLNPCLGEGAREREIAPEEVEHHLQTVDKAMT